MPDDTRADAHADAHAETRAYFAPRASGWDDRFPDDAAAYAMAARALAPAPGAVVLDAGCGTARAASTLRALVGAAGTVVGFDLTSEMLLEARRVGRGAHGAFAVADVAALPVRDGSVDAVLAAGLLPHVADADAVLVAFARAARPGARLAVFHPVNRVVLGLRHDGTGANDHLLAPAALTRRLAATGWHLDQLRHDDCYLALATRVTRS